MCSAMEGLRSLIVKMFLKGEKPGAIFRALKREGVKRDMVYRTIKRFKETSSVEDRKRSGRPRSARTKENIKIVREQIRRKKTRSVRKIAAKLGVGKSSAHLLLTKDLKMKAYKKHKIYGVTAASKEKRVTRVATILAWHAGDEFVFSDEKLFVLEEPHNCQNDRVWSVQMQDMREDEIYVPRFQNTSSVMVWAGMCKRGKLPLVFIEKGVKINAEYYKEHILQNVVLPSCKLLFGENYYCFQQDGAPSHTSKSLQEWCAKNLTDFLPKDEWPPSSPDLNPLDYFAWGYIMSKLRDKKISNIKNFKSAIAKIWDEIPMSYVRAACDSFEKRLKLVKKAKGGVIEKSLL